MKFAPPQTLEMDYPVIAAPGPQAQENTFVPITAQENSVTADTENVDPKSEETVYLECEDYLTNGTCPIGTTKHEKVVVRKRANKFQMEDGFVHYSKGEEGLRQVVTETKTKTKILEACHDDRVGGCHFGWDKTAAKVGARYYWKGIIQDIQSWVCQCLSMYEL